MPKIRVNKPVDFDASTRYEGLFVSTVGVPGSGKSTFARVLHGLFPDIATVHLLDADIVRREIIEGEIQRTVEEARVVYAEVDRRVTKLLGDRSAVILAGNPNTYDMREHQRTIAQRQGALAVHALVECPRDVARERACVLRDSDPDCINTNMPLPDWERNANAYQPLRPDELYIHIDQTSDPKLAYDALLSLWRPGATSLAAL